ncbi:hypothetical protein [Streptomyces sp. PSKA30]|uniref:hypothetical protein n=1 Tax=Streptomyces sp. PSKA30 TaxID=2874597 RepID=UPI001CD064E9|nr:hypothetical protein [Streptomyces sp. PSKA30]MBZ9643504.1 hypothetical protein [Streptomyces sp. PSKA30]
MPARLSTADSPLSQLATTPPPLTASGTSSAAVASSASSAGPITPSALGITVGSSHQASRQVGVEPGRRCPRSRARRLSQWWAAPGRQVPSASAKAAGTNASSRCSSMASAVGKRPGSASSAGLREVSPYTVRAKATIRGVVSTSVSGGVGAASTGVHAVEPSRRERAVRSR